MKTYRLGSPAAMRLEPPLDPPVDADRELDDYDDYDDYDVGVDYGLQVDGF